MANSLRSKASTQANNTDSKLPTHELVIRLTDPSGQSIQLRSSLFTQNNDGHALVSSLNSEQLLKLITEYGELSVIEAGTSTKQQRKFGFNI
ncbi:hypothetical protein ACF3N0_00150 [Moraxella atlantae]|uniref:hypothetical protein n=1 Tax=Faucicola atlantae TaxID=34059 RepID=UPI0037509B36